VTDAVRANLHCTPDDMRALIASYMMVRTREPDVHGALTAVMQMRTGERSAYTCL
jgi:hypothetical protein